MLAGLGPIGPFEGLIILLVVVLIFGVGKLSDVGGALGKSLREFRRAAREPDEIEQPQQQSNASAQPPSGPSCSNCGAQLDAGSRFCAECGSPVQAAVN
jgi:sec-independent protein translocase protein TatA